MKHAVLVLGHGDLSVLKKCMEVLDDERFDFYIHIDKKSKDDGQWLAKSLKQSKCYFVERIPVYWGHHSQTEAVAFLLRGAVDSGYDYGYYHLISAVDMPLKTPSEIDHFFETNNGTEFVRFWRGTDLNTEYNWRMQYRYPLLKLYKRSKYELISNLQKLMYSRVARLPRKPGTNLMKDKGWNVYAGDLWWSITSRFAKKFVASESEMLPYWRDCYVSDETYAQTILKHSPEYLPHQSNFQTRYIDWNRGKPYVWQIDDYEELMNTKSIFARKFDPRNSEIVNAIYTTLMEQKTNQSAGQ